MFVFSTKGGETVKRVIAAHPALQKAEFSRILKKQIAASNKPTYAVVSTQGSQTGNKTSIAPKYVFRGTISKHNPPVSSLMIKHPAYGKDCWSIIYSSINRDKAYTMIPDGSPIY